MNVALGDSAKHELAAKPTQNLPAYDAFLRGEAASQGMSTCDPPSLRQAIAAYEQAVALDSLLPWHGRSSPGRMQRCTSLAGVTPAGAEAARHAAERALALAPTRPEGHQALGGVLQLCAPRDHPRAYTEDSTALALAPGDAGLLGAVGLDELNLGRWEAARGHLEQAARLDPRSGTTADQLGQLLLYTRHYPEAERALDHALQLLPANLLVRVDRATVALAQGDLARAQAVINAAPKEVDPTALVAFVANYRTSCGCWTMPSSGSCCGSRRARSTTTARYGASCSPRPTPSGATGRRRACTPTRPGWRFEQQLQASPEDAQRHVFLGLALAYLGQKAEAIREGERGVALLPISRDAYHRAVRPAPARPHLPPRR